MKKKIFKILILIIIIFIIAITIFYIKHKIYNNIEENWIVKITPNYLNSPPNTIYLYEDSYIITNCFIVNYWQNIVHKRGKLTNKLNEDFISQIKCDANEKIENEEIRLLFSVTLNSGEELTLTANSISINEIVDMIDYDGTIWYAQQY